MAGQQGTNSAPIILVPGFWLGGWAGDEVAEALRADGHDVTALTLPGLESTDTDRSAITLDDHITAIVDAIKAADTPVVLAVHGAAGFSGYAASDRVPGRIAAMIYVDTAPGKGALDPEFDGAAEADGLGGDRGGGEPRRASARRTSRPFVSGRSRSRAP
ncbi:MAG: alpha/beta fold hydrolase [Chloroflexota bacterium]|nr:alpha/beta fold hydrolase [Chloroflexota bacterium]